MGRIKQPCCIGSAHSKGLKPICEQCGLGCCYVSNIGPMKYTLKLDIKVECLKHMRLNGNVVFVI
jgi:hypothetical protein